MGVIETRTRLRFRPVQEVGSRGTTNGRRRQLKVEELEARIRDRQKVDRGDKVTIRARPSYRSPIISEG
jgi:hypothetical protein